MAASATPGARLDKNDQNCSAKRVINSKFLTLNSGSSHFS
jgi:hypothetical protein